MSLCPNIRLQLNGLKWAIMTLADCAATIFADVCKKSNITLNKMEVVAEAEKPADSPRLSEVIVKVKTKSLNIFLQYADHCLFKKL
ncbi:MAG: hypothetical protein QXL20_02010 [Candidatus Bathyarchaeia archaeon]